MLVLIKLLVTAVAFTVKFFGKHFQNPEKFTLESDGIKYCIKKRSNKNGTIHSDIKIPFECGSVFKITEEGDLDRLFKSLGLSEEFQTDDNLFDNFFYIASDCSEFRKELKADSHTRLLIIQLFKLDCIFVSCNGSTLTVRFKGNVSDREAQAVALCTKLAKQMSNLARIKPRFITDPFQYKVLVIEAIIWGIAGYAFSGFMEWLWLPEDIHIFHGQLIRKGLFFGLVMALALVAVIFLIIRGSSRSHRILVESFLVLCISLPLGGINMVSDLNIELDSSKPQIVQAKITKLYERVTRRRRGLNTTSYYVELEQDGDEPYPDFPNKLKISWDRYRLLNGAKYVEIKVSKGYLGCPWIKGFRVVNLLSSSTF